MLQSSRLRHYGANTWKLLNSFLLLYLKCLQMQHVSPINVRGAIKLRLLRAPGISHSSCSRRAVV